MVKTIQSVENIVKGTLLF